MKAYKFKIKPNKRFLANCETTLNICRELYNAGLQERRDAYQICGTSVGFHKQAVQLPEIKRIREDVNSVYSQVLQDTLRRLSKAFDNFFRRVKVGQKPGYPRFKAKDRFDSFCYPQSGFRLEGDKLHLSKIGSCRIRLSRKIEGTIKTCTVIRQADGWFVIFAVEENQSRWFPKTGEMVGVDLNVSNFATLSTGEVIDNPRYLSDAERELKIAQRKAPSSTEGKRQKAKGKSRDFLFLPFYFLLLPSSEASGVGNFHQYP